MHRRKRPGRWSQNHSFTSGNRWRQVSGMLAEPRGHGLSVLIADDHGLFRDGLRTLLQSMPEAELAGEATNGEEAVSAAMSLQPDVVVMDIRMPGMNGIEATRRI